MAEGKIEKKGQIRREEGRGEQMYIISGLPVPDCFFHIWSCQTSLSCSCSPSCWNHHRNQHCVETPFLRLSYGIIRG